VNASIATVLMMVSLWDFGKKLRGQFQMLSSLF